MLNDEDPSHVCLFCGLIFNVDSSHDTLKKVIPKPSPLVWNTHTWQFCHRCLGGYKSPYFSEIEDVTSEIETTYEKYAAMEGLFQKVGEEKAQWLLPHLTRLGKDPTILEFGPGLGAMYKELKKLIPSVRYFAIEPNPIFSEPLLKQNIPTLTSVKYEDVKQFIEVSAGNNPLVIFMDNVLEHVAKPKQFIKMLVDCMPKGSTIFGEVPNEKGIKFKSKIQDFIRGKSKAPTFPGHINLFQLKTLNCMFSELPNINFSVWGHPLRHGWQVSYLSQSPSLNWKIQSTLKILQLIPVDSILGLDYFLRFRVSK